MKRKAEDKKLRWKYVVRDLGELIEAYRHDKKYDAYNSEMLIE